MEDQSLLIMVLQEKLKTNIINIFKNNVGYYILGSCVISIRSKYRDIRVSIQNKFIVFLLFG